MNVTCRKCEATIKVPENKIPKGQSFSFKCPSCKEKVVVPAGASAETPPPSGQDLFDTVRFETGTLLQGAMVCHTEPKKILKITDSLGISAHAPDTQAEALHRLKYNEYGLVIVSEEFEKLQNEGSSVLETLSKLTMQKRRKIFLVYIAPKVTSFGRLEGTALSVNLLVSTGDIDQTKKIANSIKKGMAEHKLDYKVYNESLSAIRSI
jgi:hypothetical protein